MNNVDTERLMELITDIRNARADVESLEEEREELVAQEQKIADRLEGIEDDIRSSKGTIESLEEELLEFARSEDASEEAEPYPSASFYG